MTLRGGRWLVGVRRAAEAPPVLHPPARSVGLVGAVGAHLSNALLLETALGLLDALRAAARHRLRVRRALGLRALLGLAQPAATALGGRELRRQLVAARVPMELVFGRVDRLGFLDDFARELLVIDVRVARRVRLDLRAVDRDDADLGEPAARAEREHLAEQARDRLLMALQEPRQGRVIRPLLRRQHPKRDVFLTGALDHARGPDPARIGVKQQRDHHRRVIRRPAAPIDPVGGIESVEVHLRDGVDDEPREVLLGQPRADVRRHQERLLAITRDKALSHARNRLKPPGQHPTYATASPAGSRSSQEDRLARLQRGAERWGVSAVSAWRRPSTLDVLDRPALDGAIWRPVAR